MSAVLVVMGILGMVDVAGVSVPGATYFAWALATVGAGLLVGTWFGRSRGLILVGFLLAGGLSIAAAAHHWEANWDGDTRTIRERPTTAAAVEAIDSEYRAGSITYDLSDVDFSGQDVQMAVDLGAGELTVVVPDDVAVVVNSEVGAGDAQVFGETRDGLGVTFDHTEPGEPDAGRVTLDLTVGLGTLEVSRVPA
jgi:hypothetical protein